MTATLKGALPLQPYRPTGCTFDRHSELGCVPQLCSAARFDDVWSCPAKAPAPRRFRAELLPNGYYRIFDYASGLAGLYTRDGHHQHGDLRLSREAAHALIRDQYPDQEG